MLIDGNIMNELLVNIKLLVLPFFGIKKVIHGFFTEQGSPPLIATFPGSTVLFFSTNMLASALVIHPL